MIMSSFLMNSPPYVDPKFPPNEEYSQGNYIPTHGADYYGPQPPHHPYGYGVNSPHTAVSYGQENGGSTAYANHASSPHHYYQHSCSLTSSAGPPIPRGSAGLPPSVDHVGNSHSPVPGLHGPLPQHHAHRSPVSSPPPNGGLPRSQPPQTTSSHPPQQGSPGLPNPDCALSSGGQPVIYPWMKKVHINAGEHLN